MNENNVPDQDDKTLDVDAGSCERVECDNCHEFYPADQLSSMDGIADGQRWCRYCLDDFLTYIS